MNNIGGEYFTPSDPPRRQAHANFTLLYFVSTHSCSLREAQHNVRNIIIQRLRYLYEHLRQFSNNWQKSIEHLRRHLITFENDRVYYNIIFLKFNFENKIKRTSYRRYFQRLFPCINNNEITSLLDTPYHYARFSLL